MLWRQKRHFLIDDLIKLRPPREKCFCLHSTIDDGKPHSTNHTRTHHIEHNGLVQPLCFRSCPRIQYNVGISSYSSLTIGTATSEFVIIILPINGDDSHAQSWNIWVLFVGSKGKAVFTVWHLVEVAAMGSPSISDIYGGSSKSGGGGRRRYKEQLRGGGSIAALITFSEFPLSGGQISNISSGNGNRNNEASHQQQQQ